MSAEIVIGGAFDEARIAKLGEAAANCRISRALNVPVAVRFTVS